MNARRLLIFQGIPAAVMVLPFVWYLIVGSDRGLKGEAGVVENLTVFFLIVAIGFSIAGIGKARRLDLSGLQVGWLVLMILGSSYFALEEISYGQHMFGWGTAETWKELNDQDETNLHNVHAIFDQVPRAILTLGILIGGVFLPLYRLVRGIELQRSDRFYWQWPTIDCVTIGLLVILIRPILSVFETDLINTGETKENLFALFIMLYCISLYDRLAAELAGKAESAEPVA